MTGVAESLAKADEDLAAALAADDCPKELFSEIAKIKEKVEGLRTYLQVKYKRGTKTQKIQL